MASGSTAHAAGLLDLIGSESSMSGGNSMAPMTMMIPSATPVKISSSSDSKGLVSTGQLTTLLPPLANGTNPDVVNVMESMKRISDAKYAQVTAYANSVPNGAALNAAALGPKGIQACSYTKSAYIVDKYGSPSAVNPDVDPNIVGSGGIFTTAEYQANSDFQKTAAVMKLVIDGNAAAGTIEIGGFDYHTGDRMTGEARDFNAGNCIGACLEYAARVGKPVMIYVFSDGSLASSGMIDNSAGRPRQGRVDRRQPEHRRFVLPGVRSQGQAGAGAKQSREELADRQFQRGRIAQYLGQSCGQQRVQSGADGGAQLHGAARRRRFRRVPDAVSQRRT